MKVSMNWLKELVEVNKNVEELTTLFNTHSAEVEEYYNLVDATNLVVGYVESKEKHPDADKLSICQVNIGDKVTQIICGAPNVDKDQHVIVALPGAVLPGNFKIKESKIRGIESNGMICSLNELGIESKYHQEEGIHVISSFVKPGMNAVEALNYNDQVFALDLTPNRADLLSMIGVAYDTKALLDTKLLIKEPTVKECDEVNTLKVETKTDKCTSYYARLIKDVEIKESPQWLKARLIASGIRPISNVVDITNYVMLLTGQPLHAFDYDLVKTNKIVVDMAENNSELVTLDEVTRKLTSNDIVITNGKENIALGGVMGGLSTEINESTKTILLESANFDPYHIRKTSNRLDLRSEASTRFERKVDPARTKKALEYATELFIELCNGKALKGISSFDNTVKSEKLIEITLTKINKVLGTDYSKDLVSKTLDKLSLTYTEKDDTFKVLAPSRRQDMETYQDVIEEVGRIIGYDDLPLSLPSTVSIGKLSELQIFKRNLRKHLSGLGLNEVITYSLMRKENVNDLTLEADDNQVDLKMPMSEDRTTLTHTPLNGIVDVIKYNRARKLEDVFVYEIGKKYTKDYEKEVLSGAITGVLSSTKWNATVEVADFYTLKGILNSLFNRLNLGHLDFEKASLSKNYHPGQSAIIKDFNNEYGFIARLHPQYEKQNNLGETYVFELDIEKLLKSRRQVKKVKEINKFPTISRDIALVVDLKISAKELLDEIKKAGKRTLTEVKVFDLFTGESLGEDKKSLAFKLEFSDPKKTLETKEVEELTNNILKAVEKKYNAVLR